MFIEHKRKNKGDGSKKKIDAKKKSMQKRRL